MSKSTDGTIILKRQFRHHRADVFAAFSSATALEKWMAPSADIKMRVTDFTFRPGGSFIYEYVMPDGSEAVVAGRFVRIENPDLLSFTWTWQKPDPHAGIESRVTVELHEHGDGTQLVITHTKLDSPDSPDMPERHNEGWEGALERLITWLDPATEKSIQEV